MDQSGFYTQPGASSQTNWIVGRLIDLEASLIRVTQALAEVDRKVDLLLGQCIANRVDCHVALAHTPTFNGAKFPTPSQILTQNGSESDYNFGMSGMSSLIVWSKLRDGQLTLTLTIRRRSLLPPAP